MKKVSKILIILSFLLIIMAICFSKISYAEDSTGTTPSEMVDQGKAFMEKGKDLVGNLDVDPDDITGPVSEMAQVATTIGAGIYLCILAYMGIKWLQAKPDEQAKLKEQTVGIFVAGIVIFGGYTIWKIAIKIVRNL